MDNDHLFDIDTLQNHNIRVLPLNLEGDESLRPRFFSPYPRESLIEPINKAVGDTYTVDDTGNYSTPKQHAYSIWLFLDSYLDCLDLEMPKDEQKLWFSKQ